ncbi:Aste57867_23908 [Aphanomyces stellatus]|uniref:Aste57867_23908 protein n=1 Tax=Aphanomyces stellatus TaxID=120398 RepID=A0A485LNV7_9STRA|nr:hypothetical protein As57867_023835 [Aphanomyces stellatus]VFU00551.1 Aste57867_23908 [Aphanomyces stellatus]
MTLLRFMKTLATGPSGPHANFIHYNIDAITLSALHDRTSITTTAPLRLVHWMRSIETVVRAVSNLEEKFHQSFYLYLLPSTRTFVSIGEYYYPMVLVMLPLFAHTLFHSTNTGGLRTAFALASFAVAAALGSILLVLTTHLSLLDPFVPLLDLTRTHHETLSRSYCWTLAGVAVACQVAAVRWFLPTLARLPALDGCVDESQWHRQMQEHRAEFEASKPEPDKDVLALESSPPYAVDNGWRAVKVLLTIYVIIVHCAIGILNYPFALACTLPMTILVALNAPSAESTAVHSGVNAVLLFLLSPAVSLLLLQHLHPSILDSLAYAINGYARHGLFAVPYLCWVYFPVHTLAVWVFVFSTAANDDSTTHDTDDTATK